MPTGYTITTIYNRALDIIAEQPIQSLNEASATVRWLNRNFSPTVRMRLRSNVWNFARKQHLLNAEPLDPKYRWRFKYGLPPGWLRVLQPTLDGRRDGVPLKFEVMDNHLYMDAPPPRPVDVIMDVQHPGEWDDLFAELIAGSLAVGLAQKTTGKNSYLQIAREIVNETIKLAEEINAYESSADEVEQYDIIRVRG